MQGRKWDELMPVDYLTIMPIPHFNDFDDSFRLPKHLLPYIQQKLVEMLSIWVDCRNWKYKPSDFRPGNKIYMEDLRAMQMIDQLHADGVRYQQAKINLDNKNEEYIASQQKEFRASKGLRG